MTKTPVIQEQQTSFHKSFVFLDTLAVDDAQTSRRMTGKKTAQKAGVSAITYSKAKNGSPVRRSTALRIARALGVPLEQIAKTEK